MSAKPSPKRDWHHDYPAWLVESPESEVDWEIEEQYDGDEDLTRVRSFLFLGEEEEEDVLHVSSGTCAGCKKRSTFWEWLGRKVRLSVDVVRPPTQLSAFPSS